MRTNFTTAEHEQLENFILQIFRSEAFKPETDLYVMACLLSEKLEDAGYQKVN